MIDRRCRRAALTQAGSGKYGSMGAGGSNRSGSLRQCEAPFLPSAFSRELSTHRRCSLLATGVPLQRRGMNTDFRTMSRAELRQEGLSRVQIDRAVTSGTVVRPRRNVYVSSTTPDQIVRAVRVGGRLTCLSLLAWLGVFVFRNDSLHVHMSHTAGRMRSPSDPKKRLETRLRRKRVKLHWLPLIHTPSSFATCVGVVDALTHAVLCQSPRNAIATIDSALNKGLVTMADIADVFSALPSRFGVLRPLIDGRAESGPETLMRLMLRGMGLHVELQVEFDGIGRVDLVANGWLVIECDSKKFHENWKQQVKDRRRDVALAARGFVTLRFTAAMIMSEPHAVLAAVRGLLGTRETLTHAR